MAAPTDDETTTASTTLQMNAVTVERGTKTLVDNINWAVEDGQRWVVLGRNGSGKTTLLRLASLYLHPSSGRIEVLGEALGHTDVRLLRRRIGLVSPAMADLIRPDLTPRDIVMSAKFAALEPWWHAYADHDRERAVQCLAQMGVEFSWPAHLWPMSNWSYWTSPPLDSTYSDVKNCSDISMPLARARTRRHKFS